MGRRLLDGCRTRTCGPPWPVWQPGANRFPAWAGDVFGRGLSGREYAGTGFQGMGIANPLHAQHPASWHRVVRAHAGPGDTYIRGDQTPRQDLKKPVRRSDLQKSAQFSRGRGLENIGGILGLHPHHFHRGVCDQPAPSAANPAVERDLCCRTGGGDNNSAVRLAVGPHRTPHLLFSRHVFHGVFRLPAVLLLGTKDPLIIILTVVVALSFGHGTMFGLQSAYFPELFGTRVRYTGASFGFQLSAALGGGFSPLIATALAGYMGGTAGVSMMLILLAAITFIATLFATETKHQPLTD